MIFYCDSKHLYYKEAINATAILKQNNEVNTCVENTHDFTTMIQFYQRLDVMRVLTHFNVFCLFKRKKKKYVS